jgi:hypothetical protein
MATGCWKGVGTPPPNEKKNFKHESNQFYHQVPRLYQNCTFKSLLFSCQKRRRLGAVSNEQLENYGCCMTLGLTAQ